MDKDTTTQVLQRIEATLASRGGCIADTETYQKHCLVLQSLQESIPRLEKTLERIDARLDGTEKAITVIQTEKRTGWGIAAFLGALGGWLASIFKN